MSVSVTYGSTLSVVETLTGNAVAASDKNVSHTLYNSTVSLTAATTPPATLVACFEKALAAGVATIDLTALSGTNGIVVDGTGLRVQMMKIRNKSTNANPITISFGAATPYDGFGAAFNLTLVPGAEALLRTIDAGSNIGAGCKHLDLAGTLAQVLEVEIVLG